MRLFLINIAIVLIYGLIYYFWLEGISGGDIALTALFSFTAIIQMIIVVYQYRKRKKIFLYSVVGILLGFIICYYAFEKQMDKRRNQESGATPADL